MKKNSLPNSFPCLLLFVGVIFATSIAAKEDFRTFTNTAGKTLEARVDALKGDQVTIVLRNGREFTIPVSSLSEADREYLSDWSAGGDDSTLPSGGVDAAAVNDAIGHALFADRTLWSSDPSAVAARLEWPRESKTEISESYRAYPGEDYRFLGARPYSAALYGKDGQVKSLSIVFANKGDSFAAAGGGEDHFIDGEPVPGGMEGVRVIMENDAETIAEKLTSLLGEPERQRFGDGESRVEAERWDWAGHAFLLAHVENEYVSLAIETTEFADERGQTSRVSDDLVRERARGFVERRDNGDVVVTNIPMVDQGPKGYCVPATAERCMRYMGIPADMYLLAMVGGTGAGGGTSVEKLFNNVGRDIRSKGRSFEIESGELELHDIRRTIDDGIPIMWACQSTEAFNRIATERTRARQEESWESYKATVAEAADDPSLAPDPSRGHVVIIIGYNEETEEIAFSDSWGERYRERWITVAEARQVSQDRFYLIEP